MTEAAADTNLFVRVLVDEPNELTERAKEILSTAERRGVQILVTPMVVAEIVFVMERFDGWTRGDIVPKLGALLGARPLVVLELGSLIRALDLYGSMPGLHFVDAFVAATALQRGHGNVISFDRGLRRAPGLNVIEDTRALTALG